jgi:hypothetical protein
MRESRSISGDFRSSTSKFSAESYLSSYQMKRRIEPDGFNNIEYLELPDDFREREWERELMLSQLLFIASYYYHMHTWMATYY